VTATDLPAGARPSRTTITRYGGEVVLWAIAAIAVIGLRHSLPAYALTVAACARISYSSPTAGLGVGLLWIGAIGTEFRPSMLHLAGPQVRLTDFVLLGAVVGGIQHLRPGRPSPATALLLATIASMAIAMGRGSASVAEATGHQLAVGVAGYVLARRVARQPRGVEMIVGVLLIAGTVASLKAVALWVGGMDVTGGPASALQAVSRVEPIVFSRRTLLIGGSLLSVLAVPLALGLSGRARALRWSGTAVLLSLLAVFVSLTRTNLIAAAVGLVLAAATIGARDGRIRGRGVVSVVAAAWIVALAVTWSSTTTPWGSTVARFGSGQARHQSLGFREDEVRAVLDSLDGPAWVFGRGMGGTFVLDAPGTNPAGNSYAHAWPTWLLLKGGATALLLAVLAFGALLWRLTIRPRDEIPARRALGAALVALLVSALGVNSLPLAEGALVLGAIAAAAAATPDRAPPGSSRWWRRRSDPT
jgi:hypothetical protein